MERQGRLSGCILMILAAVHIYGCTGKSLPAEQEQTVTFRLRQEAFCTKGEESPDNLIADVNIIAFNGEEAELSEWMQTDWEEDISIRLVKDRTYSIYVLANAGRKLDITSLKDLEKAALEVDMDTRFSGGIPMYYMKYGMVPEDEPVIEVELKRMVAKISIRMDRSGLSEGINMNVKKIRIGNYPRYISLTGNNFVGSEHDRFETGYELDEEGCILLNNSGRKGISGEVDLYVPENMQGDFPFSISSDEEKVIDKDDPLFLTCSYMEIEMYYRSDTLLSYDSNLIYRFYLGGGLDNLDIEGNCHYHITITPEDDGLSGSGWRVDKSGIGPAEPFMTLHPGSYIEGKVGEDIHIWCDFYPRSTEFDVGKEELEYDRNRGIYDYTIDENGHGVTLHLKKPGTGIVYMSAGEPINCSKMAIIVVSP